MLTRLLIQNIALVERAELEFGAGFNVLSGETGAGKSVILDSIDFVLGAKADKSLIRHGASECSVRAEFTAVGDEVLEILRDMDIECEDVLILSRRFTADGRSALRLNGCPVTASMLRRVSARLVDIHGQSDHFYLLNEANQARLLDEVAGEGVAEEKNTLALLLKERGRLRSEMNTLGGDAQERARRADVLTFQVQEITRAGLKEGEEEELLAFRNRCRNSERILEGLNTARDALSSDGGCLDAVNSARRSLHAIGKFDEKYDGLSERLDGVLAELDDVSATIEEYADELDFDEKELERVENRLDEIKSLKKKYGETVALISAFCERASEELAALTDGEARLKVLQEEMERNAQEVYSSCERLSSLRKEAAKDFTARVTSELKTLNISSARFEVQFDSFLKTDVENATTNGLDRLRFLFSANVGEPVKELGKIISGGEMSRFMLAVKAQLSGLWAVGTYLFDEIDAGIGGRTARVMGEKFCKMARSGQIIAITHSAQIACFADRHYLIEKVEENATTRTTLCAVEGEERVREICRLSGGTESAAALEHARELLSESAAYKKSL